MKKLDKSLILDLISAFARFFMAYIWIAAGVEKLNKHFTMTQTIEAYQIFTPEWSHYLAYLIGPLEIAGGVLLLLGLFMRPAAKVGIIVLVLFMIGIGQAWARGLDIDCGCFEVDPANTDQVMDYVKTLGRDLFFLVLMVWIWVRPFKKFAVYP
ncbi:MauE/DoxX family redox-associated membrane protein [Corynebacterium sp. 32222D000AT]|uniref:MauE/DoxX family redox-associated membrane protein n=1 Tax=unclassified Corynebacterium TaxID=2624378 RepID=UPI002A9671EC|nr:DoxX family membrane protein [Mycobacteriaceae bacterium]MDY5829379.1 DoxX family membrane protein [Corynebacterium sp.]